MEATSFSALELEQYSRHLRLPGFGIEHQKRLKNSSVLLVGAGGLGCPAGLYLAASGVGNITVIDFDQVERSNLQRQVAYCQNDLGLNKAERLVVAMQGLNPFVQYTAQVNRLDETNVMSFVRDASLVLDGSDNFRTRFLLADACYLSETPLLQGAVQGFSSQVALFNHVESTGPCYRCMFREPPANPVASCDEMGVLGVLPGTTGLMMATEAIKFLTGMSSSIVGKLLQYDSFSQTIQHLALQADPDCPLCGTHQIKSPQPVQSVVCQSDKMQKGENGMTSLLREMTVAELLTVLEGSHPPLLVDVREVFEYEAGAINNSVNVPLSQIEESAGSRSAMLQLFPKAVQALMDSSDNPEAHEPTVVLYCKKGGRSMRALEILAQQEVKALPVSLSGGYLAWVDAN